MKHRYKILLCLTLLAAATPIQAVDASRRLMVNPISDFALNPRNVEHLMNQVLAQTNLYSQVSTLDRSFRDVRVAFESEVRRMIKQGPGVVAMGSGTTVLVLSDNVQAHTEALFLSVAANPDLKWLTVPQEAVPKIYAALERKNVRTAMGHFFDNADLSLKSTKE
jgi:hypothetical protein